MQKLLGDFSFKTENIVFFFTLLIGIFPLNKMWLENSDDYCFYNAITL